MPSRDQRECWFLAGAVLPIAALDKKFATNYIDLLHHPLEKQGIDFWWLDWQQQPTTKLPRVGKIGTNDYEHLAR